MTGYESKRAAARDKLDDDDTQVYQDHDDTLTIAYQSGYYDGKKAAAQEPVEASKLNVELLSALTACLDWMERMRVSGDAGNWKWGDDEYTKGRAIEDQLKEKT